jgi:hypothetical protein
MVVVMVIVWGGWRDRDLGMATDGDSAAHKEIASMQHHESRPFDVVSQVHEKHEFYTNPVQIRS